jgi:hypothetical protein
MPYFLHHARLREMGNGLIILMAKLHPPTPGEGDDGTAILWREAHL